MAAGLTRVKMTIATPPGVGSLAADTGVADPMFRSLAERGVTGTIYPYALEAPPLWETGHGTYQADGTFTRDAIIDGSSGPGVPVDFTGSVKFAGTLLAQDVGISDTLTALIYAGL